MSTPRRCARRRAKGLPNWRIVRYADDFVILKHGTRDDAETMRDDIARVLEPMGLRFSEAKTQVEHLDDGSISSASDTSASDKRRLSRRFYRPTATRP